MEMSIDLKSSVYRPCFLSPQAEVASESGVELEKEEMAVVEVALVCQWWLSC